MTCRKCGEVLPESATTCSFCGEPVSAAPQPTYENPANPQPETPVEEKHENVVGGTVGAFLGALLGAASIVLVGQLGYVASICGVILAFCALKGYELLGGKLSTRGIIISVVMMLIMPVVAYFLNEAILVMREIPGATLSQSLNFMFEVIKADSELQGAVVTDLVKFYAFTALGAVAMVVNAFKKNKK